MKTRPHHFETLLHQAGGRRGLDPLLRALGFTPRLTPVPGAAHRAYGLAGEKEIRALVIAGERAGLLALLLELRSADSPAEIARIARRVRAHNPVRPLFFLFAGPRYRRLGFASFGTGGELRQLLVDRGHPRRSDLETLEELAAREGEGGIELLHRHARALDRTRLTRQFFRDFRAQRDQVANAWMGVPRDCRPERDQLALLFLCRLLFLYFLQKPGFLNDDAAYLPGLLRRWNRRARRSAGSPSGGPPSSPLDGPMHRSTHSSAHTTSHTGSPGRETFYRRVLAPLFFGALNTRPERRAAETAFLGPLPYLNGGLFERHALERRFPELNLEDDVITGIFADLLERYRFTTREAAEAAADAADEMGIDPEMLGRVFEELMAADRREASGTFFTPAAVVDRLVKGALEVWLGGVLADTGALRPTADPVVTSATEPVPTAITRVVDRGDPGPLPQATRQLLADALARIRVLDPACGSGAFLLGALSRIARTRAALEGRAPSAYRREIVARALHGVDLHDDAALLCALRLWLALTLGENDRTPDPLPNLDRKIRQGDALVDPLDLIMDNGFFTPVHTGRSPHTTAQSHSIAHSHATTPWHAATRDAGVRRALRAIPPLAAGYLAADPEERQGLQHALANAETALARAWLEATRRHLTATIAELHATAASLDLFGELPPSAPLIEATRRALTLRVAEVDRLQKTLEESGALPFFSFEIHFADPASPGFDLILSNPPWVRAHSWPAGLGRLVRQRYAVCRDAGWRQGTTLTGTPAAAGAQVDLSLLFLERSLRLLAPRGVLAMLIPAKAIRSLYGGGGRKLLLRETRLYSLEDHSLDQRSIFRADAYAAAVVAQRNTGDSEMKHAAAQARTPASAGLSSAPNGSPSRTRDGVAPSPGDAVRVTMIRRGVPPLRYAVPQTELPIFPGDPEAPWLLAPPAARAALRKMQAAGPPLGSVPELRVRRGVATGANDIFLITETEPKLGGLAWIRAEGFGRARREGWAAPAARRYEAFIESSVLRPLIRGSNIGAWRFQTTTNLLWLHDDLTAAPLEAPPRAARYLARHDAALRARSGWRPTIPTGAIFRASPATTGHKVAWQDLAGDLEAVAIPARARGPAGCDVPVIPLNTIYFIPTATHEEALLLAALLNSLPVRTFARAMAERAKDARFRFQAWTIALTPLPQGWESSPAARELLQISRAAHNLGGITPAATRRLDHLAAHLYGLQSTELESLAEFDRWLRGISPPAAQETPTEQGSPVTQDTSATQDARAARDTSGSGIAINPSIHPRTP